MAESIAMEDAPDEKEYPVRRLFCTPIFHAFSLILVAVNALRYGHQTYVMKRFDDTFSQKVYQLQITETAATPAILHRLTTTDKVQMSDLASLRLIWCGGTTLTSVVRQKALMLLRQDIRIVQVWGMTEGGWFTTFHHPENNHDGSVGRLLDGWTMRVLTEPVGYDQTTATKGEIHVRGPQLMTEYYNDPVATREAFDSGWFKTGDVGYIQGGKVYLIGRAKNMIKVNGFQVAPAELEDVVVGHPKVEDCAVTSGGSGLSEHPLVFLVSSDSGLSEADMQQYMLRFLTRYKVLRCRMRFVKEIPRGETGKVLMYTLKASGSD
jgi:acyl-coenzyme A synthetase/AMP-(fatty) acid ligase